MKCVNEKLFDEKISPKTNIYIFIALVMDESVILPNEKNITARDLKTTPSGGATSKSNKCRLFTFVDVTSVACRHENKKKKKPFGLHRH